VGDFLPWRVVRSALETPSSNAGDDAVLEDLGVDRSNLLLVSFNGGVIMARR
jgi:hypothetical protein